METRHAGVETTNSTRPIHKLLFRLEWKIPLNALTKLLTADREQSLPFAVQPTAFANTPLPISVMR